MTTLSVVFRELTKEQVDSLLAMTKNLGHDRLVMSAGEGEADKDPQKMSDHELRRELVVTRRIIGDIYFLTKDSTILSRRMIGQMEDYQNYGQGGSATMSGADFEGLFHDWASLLDAIELALGDEAVFDRAHELVKGRFAIAEKYGLTVEFTGMPASGAKH